MYARRCLSVLASALAIAVCAYISYISSDVEPSSLAINFGFLAVMLIAIVIAFFSSMFRLMRVNRGLDLASDVVRMSDSEDQLFLDKNLFREPFLNECFARYGDMVRSHPDGSCDINDFINEDSIDTYIHRSLLELVPDFLTSLGILGTFIGLVFGLRSFDPSGYEQMADSVSPLIDGIKVAFVTSIYGLALSLPFSLNLRSEHSGMLAALDSFTDSYYLYVRPSNEVSAAAKMKEQQKSREDLANHLAQIFADQLSATYEQTIVPAFGEMTNAVNEIVQTYTAQQEDTVAQICASIVNDIHGDLDDSFQSMAKDVQQLEKAQNNYIDFMNHSTKQLQQSFISLQNHIEQADQYNEQTMDTLTKAQQDAFRVTEEQKATYQEYIRFMYQSIEEFSNVWELNNEKLQGYSDEIMKLGPVQSNIEVRKDIADLSAQLKEVRKLQATAEELEFDHEKTEQLLDELTKKVNELEKLTAQPVLFRRRNKR